MFGENAFQPIATTAVASCDLYFIHRIDEINIKDINDLPIYIYHFTYIFFTFLLLYTTSYDEHKLHLCLTWTFRLADASKSDHTTSQYYALIYYKAETLMSN